MHKSSINFMLAKRIIPVDWKKRNNFAKKNVDNHSVHDIKDSCRRTKEWHVMNLNGKVHCFLRPRKVDICDLNQFNPVRRLFRHDAHLLF